MPRSNLEYLDFDTRSEVVITVDRGYSLPSDGPEHQHHDAHGSVLSVYQVSG
jgi:hypothetical protein